MHKIDRTQSVGLEITRAGETNKEHIHGPLDGWKPKGHFKGEIIRKDGTVEPFEMNNDIVNVGKNMILNVMFNGGTASGNSAWVIGLINNAGFSALAAADTMASHTGWAEFVGYSGGVRPGWGSGSASGQAVTNGTAVTFNITSSATLYGVFICDNNTLSGTSGNLWATAGFASTVPVNNGDQIKITYTVSS